jgi:hypothetical protein
MRFVHFPLRSERHNRYGSRVVIIYREPFHTLYIACNKLWLWPS